MRICKGLPRGGSRAWSFLAGISLAILHCANAHEIELLVAEFVAAACRQIDRGAPLAVSPAALEHLRAHAWPGNVRELRNVMERATVLCAGETILPEHLPPSVLERRGAPRASAGPSQDDVESLERTRIADALDRCGGNQSRAAALLGIARGTLIARIAKFGLHRPQKRPDDAGT